MYSGPFILWNFDSPELDADEDCIPLNTSEDSKQKK
jgi:hypothetical protein